MHAARLFAPLAVATTLFCAPLTAQPPAPRAAPVEPIIARGLTRAALVDLRVTVSPGPADFRIAAMLFREAAALDPANSDILHLAIDAAKQSGDQAGALELLKRLVALDPLDTAAQLALIDARAAMQNTIQERIAMCDAILGPRGVNIDPSVRSRVALRAAMLLRELGETDNSVKHLTAAVQLDSSNTEAAALALEHYTSHGGDASGRVELLVNQLNANPLDPNTHLSLAHEFAAVGAYEASLRFYENARLLANRIGAPLPIEDQAERIVQTWKKNGAAAVVKELNDALESARRGADVDIAIATANHKPVDQLTKSVDIRLPLQLERVRIAAALAAGDKPTTQSAITDFGITLDFNRAKGALSPAALRSADYELAFVRGWSGVGRLEFEDTLARLRADKATPPDVIARLDAWAKVRDDPAGARAAFAAMKDDGLARLAIAQMDLDSKEAPGDLEERLARLALDVPDSPISAWAMSVYTQRHGSPPPASPTAQRFAAMAAGIPAWIDVLARDPWHDVVVVAITPDTSLGPLDAAIITLRIRNNSPVPLAFGPNNRHDAMGCPISSEFLVMTSVDASGVKQPALGGSEPTTMWRRLRIMPHQEVSITFWADPGITGWAAESALTGTLRTRWHLVQGFRILDGAPVPGPLGASFDATPVFRAGFGPVDLDKLIAQIASAKDADLAKAVLAARQVILDVGSPKGIAIADAHRLMAALVDRYAGETRLGRLAILLYTPGPRLAPVTADLDRALAQSNETDTLVGRVAILTRADDPASPLLAAALKSTDPELRAFADAFAKRLVTPAKTLARLTSTSVEAITGIAPPAKTPPSPAPGTDPNAPAAAPAPEGTPAPTPPEK